MKRIIKLSVFIFIIIIFATGVGALEYEFESDDKSDSLSENNFDEIIKSLPDDVRSEMEDYADADSDEGKLEAVKDKLDLKYWLGYAFGEIKKLLTPTLRDVSSLLGIILISSLLGMISKIKTNERLKDISELVVTLCISLEVTKISLSVIESAGAFVTRLCAMMNAMLPVMNAVYITSGSITQMTVNSSALMLYVTIVENLNKILFVPLAGALFALISASALYKSVNIGSFIEAVKKLTITMMTFSMLIFSFILGIQSSLAKSSDTLAARTVKFALGSYVPIVGGAVSEALSTVNASFSLIKKVSGSAGIIIILLLLVPTLVTLIINKISLGACRCAADMLGCETAAKTISEASSVLSIFAAIASISSVLFIFAVTLFMNSGTVL